MTYRVIQWATGAMGKAVLRSLIDHPGTEVVGVLVYGDDKVGLDAGLLARREPLGVHATNSIDDVLALDADVVIHASRLGPYGSHDDDLIRILRAGKNVITINGYSRPEYWVGRRHDALEAACRAGGTTLMSAGLNPGFMGEQLAVTMSGLCSAISSIDLVEYADSREIADPDYLFEGLGFGADPGDIDPDDSSRGPVSALHGMYSETIAAVAYRMGLTVDRVETDHRIHCASNDLELAAGVVKRGTVSHTNWRWTGFVDAGRTIAMSINWFVDDEHLDRPDPPLWDVTIVGQPGVRASVEVAKNPDDRSRMSPEQYALAGSVINTIPYLVAAPTGVATRPVVTPFRADYGRVVPTGVPR